ncbi:MAG: hypothetical protein ACO3A4_05540 [Silvanigrellaceae bacterium]
MKKKSTASWLLALLVSLQAASCKPQNSEQEAGTSSALLSSRGLEISALWPAIKLGAFSVLAEDFATRLTVQTHLERQNIQVFDYFTKLPNLLHGERFGVSEIHYSDLFAKSKVVSGIGSIGFSYYPVQKPSLESESCWLVEILNIHLPNLGISWKSRAHFFKTWTSHGAAAPAPPKYVNKICFGIANPSIEG